MYIHIYIGNANGSARVILRAPKIYICIHIYMYMCVFVYIHLYTQAMLMGVPVITLRAPKDKCLHAWNVGLGTNE